MRYARHISHLTSAFEVSRRRSHEPWNDIQRQLPAEAKMFMTVDKSWKDIMRKVYKVPLALRATTQPGLLETFQNNNTLLDQIMKVRVLAVDV